MQCNNKYTETVENFIDSAKGFEDNIFKIIVFNF